MTEEVQVDTKDHVTTISLNRPSKRNALTQAMYAAMTEALETAAGNDDVRLVRLRGLGPDFTSGNDLKDFAAVMEQGETRPPALDFLHAVVDFPKPMLAQVNGHAVGIGTTLLLHCDFVLAASNAHFALPFVHLGVVPEFGSSILLPELAGRQKAARILLLGESLNAKQLQQMGLLTALHTPESLEAAADRMAGRLAEMPPGAIQATRALLRPEDERSRLHAAIDREWEVFKARLSSPEHKAAVEAFFNKRQ